ncbi:MAG: aminoacyl-tRNA hydrolase [Myxococcales bacterium]
MLLVAGLGNPGPKYQGHRHNVGFMVVERFAEQYGPAAWRDKFHGRFAKVPVMGGRDAVLLEPMTYMNLSGRSVQAALAFFKLGLSDLVVVHDELDLSFGELRIKRGGGTAGHNGLKSIVESCGGPDFVRIRVGIGRPRGSDVQRHVLSDFSKQESAELDDVLERATSALRDLVQRGVVEAMNLHNRRS